MEEGRLKEASRPCAGERFVSTPLRPSAGDRFNGAPLRPPPPLHQQLASRGLPPQGGFLRQQQQPLQQQGRSPGRGGGSPGQGSWSLDRGEELDRLGGGPDRGPLDRGFLDWGQHNRDLVPPMGRGRSPGRGSIGAEGTADICSAGGSGGSGGGVGFSSSPSNNNKFHLPLQY